MTAPTAHPAGDDELHRDVSTDPWLTETAWYSFWTPSGDTIVHVYLRFRHNLGVADCSVYAWTPGQSLPWDAAYWKQSPGPVPESLTALTMANGLRHEQVDPYRVYRIQYEDRTLLGDPFRFDVTFTATSPPRWFGRRHFDQPGHVVGELELDGSRQAIDCLAMRDRSWYHRSDFGLFRSAYAYALSPRQSWLAIFAAPRDDLTVDELPLAGGWWTRGAQAEPVELVAGTRRVIRRDATTGAPLEVELHTTGVDDSVLTARGVVTNSMALAANTSMFSWMSLVSWEAAGEQVVGEDQAIWSPSVWRAVRGRVARPLGGST